MLRLFRALRLKINPKEINRCKTLMDFPRVFVSPAGIVHHDASVAAMMRQGDVFKGNNYYTRRTGHQFETALMMGAVADGAGIKTRRQLPRRIPDKADVFRVEDTLLTQLQV